MGKKADIRFFEHSFRSLHEATLLSEVDVCKFLLKFGVPIDARNEQQQTALILASAQGHHELVELYLNYGAALDLFDHEGSTALMLAASKGHTPIVKLLLKAGADPRIQNDRGETALVIAQRYGKFETAAALSKDKKTSWFDFAQAWYRFAKTGLQRLS